MPKRRGTLDMEVRGRCSSGRPVQGMAAGVVVAFGAGRADERAETVDGMRFLLDRDCDGLVVLSNAIRAMLASWCKTLAGEVAVDGVTVNLLLPGQVATDRLASLHEAMAQGSGMTAEQVGARAKAAIENAGGQAVTGYRAPSFSIDTRTPWAHPVLAERLGVEADRIGLEIARGFVAQI